MRVLNDAVCRDDAWWWWESNPDFIRPLLLANSLVVVSNWYLPNFETKDCNILRLQCCVYVRGYVLSGCSPISNRFSRNLGWSVCSWRPVNWHCSSSSWHLYWKLNCEYMDCSMWTAVCGLQYMDCSIWTVVCGMYYDSWIIISSRWLNAILMAVGNKILDLDTWKLVRGKSINVHVFCT